MISHLLALWLFIQNPNSWKDQVYEEKYNEAIIGRLSNYRNNTQRGISKVSSLQRISWYSQGLKDPNKLTCACWDNYPKGTKFKVTYNNSSVIVVCDDRGNFQKMGRFLDLSSGAFKTIAPLSKGIIEAKVEIIQ